MQVWDCGAIYYILPVFAILYNRVPKTVSRVASSRETVHVMATKEAIRHILSSGRLFFPTTAVRTHSRALRARASPRLRTLWRASPLPVTAQPQRRRLSFSFPGPRKLGDITNLPLLEKEPAENIADIWTAYHDERADSLGMAMPGDALIDLRARAKKCPMFILPVWREGGHFMILSQYQDTCFLLTYLEDYKANPEGAQPYATVSMYDDLVDTKALGLIRADITPNLTKKEVARLIRLLIRYYSPHAHHHVEAFNLRPEQFDLDALVQETPRD